MQLIELTDPDNRQGLYDLLDRSKDLVRARRCLYVSVHRFHEFANLLDRVLDQLAHHGPFGQGDLLVLDRSNEMSLNLPVAARGAIEAACVANGLLPGRVVAVSQVNALPDHKAGETRFGWVPYHSWPARFAAHYAAEHDLGDFGYGALYDLPPRFLCLNKKLRPHRYILLDHIRRSVLADAVTVTNVSVENLFDRKAVAETIGRQYPDFAGLIGAGNEVPPLESTGLLDEDGNNRIGTPALPGLAFPVRETRASHLALVTESDFAVNVTRFSEKLLKPIVSHRPFLAFASAGSLMQLRDHGFQTFDGLIDESYDLISHPNDRMIYLLAEAERLLSNLADEVWRREFLDGARAICAHNQRHLLRDFLDDIDRRAVAALNAHIERRPPALAGAGGV